MSTYKTSTKGKPSEESDSYTASSVVSLSADSLTEASLRSSREDNGKTPKSRRYGGVFSPQRNTFPAETKGHGYSSERPKTTSENTADQVAYEEQLGQHLPTALKANFVSILAHFNHQGATDVSCINLDCIFSKDHTLISECQNDKDKLRLFLAKLTDQPYRVIKSWLDSIDPSISEIVWKSFQNICQARLREGICSICQMQNRVPIRELADYLFQDDILSNYLMVEISRSDPKHQKRLYEELVNECRKNEKPKHVLNTIRNALSSLLSEGDPTFVRLSRELKDCKNIGDFLTCRCSLQLKEGKSDLTPARHASREEEEHRMDTMKEGIHAQECTTEPTPQRHDRPGAPDQLTS